MSARYVRDPTGTVHLEGPYEDTLCSRDYAAADTWEETESFEGESCSGPATCRECKDAVDRLRNAIRGARWRLP